MAATRGLAHRTSAKLPFAVAGLDPVEQAAALRSLRPVGERLLAGRLFLPAVGEFAAGRPADWFRDYRTGERWPQIPARKIAPGLVPGSDIRHVWEINRLQHLPLLGVIGALSGDAAYFEAFRVDMVNWLEVNFPWRGPNWTSPMEAAIRAINVLAARDLFADRIEADPPLAAGLSDGLMEHGRFIRANLEIRRTPTGRRADNNHYLSNLLGLMFLGTAFSGTAEGRAWWRESSRRFPREFLRQMHPEGSNFESSLGYHRLVTEMGVLATLLMLARDVQPAPAFVQRLARALALLSAARQPDGTLPDLGDSDDGRILPLTRYFDPSRQEPDAGNTWADWLFSSPAAPDSVEGRFFCGELVRRGRLPLPAEPAARGRRDGAYPRAGWFFHRDGGDYLAVSAGEVGTALTGNHKHNDLLSLVYWRKGCEILTDPGTASYTGIPELRERFRATLAHNTVAVDGEEQNRRIPGVLFALEPDAFPVPEHWRRDGRSVSFAGWHTGYRRLPASILHHRVVTYLPGEGILAIRDRLRAQARKRRSFRYTASLHLPERFSQARTDLAASIGDGLLISRIGELAGGWQFPFEADLLVEPAGGEGPVRFLFGSNRPLAIQVEEDLVSRAYGRVAPAMTVRVSGEGDGEISLLTAILT
jgi:hypothetical protein